MKKNFRDLKAGTPFKHKEQVYIKDDTGGIVRLTDGEVSDEWGENVLEVGPKTPVTVCKRIRKSDIKERK